MKKWFLLFLPIILVGQGCATPAVEDSSGDMVLEGEEMMVEGEDEEDMEVEEGEEMDSEDAEMSDDEDADAEKITFDVSGTNFAFDVTEMRVKKGQTVTVNFESAEGFHDWVVDEFNAATQQVKPEDGVTSATFVADEAGEYEYYCSVGQHRELGMVGTLIVE